MSGKIVVCKFGGTSLATSSKFLEVRSIVRLNPERRYVVVSAPGKLGEQEKVTELLACCHKSVADGRTNNFELLFAEISERFVEIARGLSIGGIETILETIRVKTLQGASLAWVMSRGEYVNALLFARLMEWPCVDAADVVRFNATGTLDLNETRTLLRSYLEQHEYAVIPGFYGSDLGGTIHLFPRGGSDVTGSHVAVAMEAALYENWTDVSGLFLADPHIVQDPHPISQVTYAELRELGNWGPK
jgi:aspartate kinase